jgi:hypothetical protein
MLDVDTPWFSNLPVDRLLKALLNTMQSHANRFPYVVSPVLNVLFTLSTINAPLWLEVLKPTFALHFYNLAIGCQIDTVREHAWNCLRGFFTKCSHGAFSPSNGTEENGSDIENKMDIDPNPTGVRDIVSFLWESIIRCLIMAKADIPNAAKAFETAADILRYIYLER